MANTAKEELVKDKIRDYLSESWGEMINDIKSLEPKERVDRRLKLMDYVFAKQQSAKGEDKKKKPIAKIILEKESDFGDYVEEEDSE